MALRVLRQPRCRSWVRCPNGECPLSWEYWEISPRAVAAHTFWRATRKPRHHTVMVPNLQIETVRKLHRLVDSLIVDNALDDFRRA